MKEDKELLQLFATERNETSFRTLVERHLPLVYSSALRQLNGDAHLAADVAQTVFVDLAAKAGSLVGHRMLAGWLFTSTRYAAAKAVRSEQRRRAREREAQLMENLPADDAATDWNEVRRVLDAALADLQPRDRDAVLMRFFERLEYRDIGARLHLGENAVRMRVDRALDMLRTLLQRRGVKSTSAALAAALSAHAVAAVPAGLATQITATAVAGTGAVSLWAAFLAMNKLHIGLTGALAIAGATGFVLEARTTAALRQDVAALQAETSDAGRIRSENQTLARTAAEVAGMKDDAAQFERLNADVAELSNRLQSVNERKALNAAAEKDVKTLDRLPVLVSSTPPRYPADLRQQNIAGQVVVEFIVDQDGNVPHAVIVSSSRREFEAPALEAVKSWRFDAGLKGGRAVNTRMEQAIEFNPAGPGASTEAKPKDNKDGIIR